MSWSNSIKATQEGLMPRGQAPFIAGIANAHYTGLLECGHTVRAAVVAPGDSIQIKDGYIAISATPV